MSSTTAEPEADLEDAGATTTQLQWGCLLCGLGAIVWLAVFSHSVVPTFEVMFRDLGFGERSRLLTLAMFTVSDWIGSAAGLAGLACVALGIVVAFVRLGRSRLFTTACLALFLGVAAWTVLGVPALLMPLITTPMILR